MHEKDWYVYGPIIIFVVGLTLYCVLRAKKGDRKDQLFGCSFMAGSFLLVFGGIVVTCTSGILWDGEHTNEKSDYVEKFNIVDEKKHGLYESRYKSNNTLKQKGQYDMGNKVGVWTQWYSTGEQESETNYSKYDPYRLEQTWHKNGQVESIRYYDLAGETIGNLTELFYENGQQELKGRAGRFEDGTEKTWYENGELHKIEVWEDGKLLLYERYEEDGSPCQFTTYKDGNGVVAEQYRWADEPHKLLVYKNYKVVKTMSENY